MARRKKTLRGMYDQWLEAHPAAANAIVGCSAAAALIAVFVFVTFSGFGGSAEFIYNQF